MGIVAVGRWIDGFCLVSNTWRRAQCSSRPDLHYTTTNLIAIFQTLEWS